MKKALGHLLYNLWGRIPYTVVDGLVVHKYPKIGRFIISCIYRLDPQFTDGG